MTTWDNENKYDILFKSLSFLLSPLLGVLASVYRINTRSSFVVLFLTVLTFGLALDTPNFETNTFRYDAASYRRMFESHIFYSVDDVKSDVVDYAHDFIGKDIVLQLIMFSVSRFTGNYHYFYLVVALIFGLAYLMTLRYFVSERNYKFALSPLLLLLVFSLPAAPAHLSILRWFLACWLSLYALIRIFVSKNKWYIILLGIACAMHGSFIVFIPVVAGALLLSLYPKTTPFVLCVSVLVSSLIIKVAMLIVPMIFGARFSLYIDPDYISQINSGGSGWMWLERLVNFILLLLNTFICVVFALNYESNIKSTKYESIYFVLISLVVFVNLTISIPCVGSRFIMITYPLIAYIFLTCFAEHKFKYLIYVYSGFIIMCILTFNRFYHLPCLKDYFKLWQPDFYVTSPLYSVYKYLIMY